MLLLTNAVVEDEGKTLEDDSAENENFTPGGGFLFVIHYHWKRSAWGSPHS